MTSSNRQKSLDPVEQLVAASRELMADALQAYGQGRPLKVAASAPVAIEQLTKALLWQTNPALLVMLDRSHEESLRILTGNAPSLAHPRLRTVGLDAALRRVPETIVETVSKEKRQELINARNGAVHVGQAKESASILATALKIANRLLEALSVDSAEYYKPHTETVANLLMENRTEVQRTVDQKMARARFRWEEFKDLSHDQLTALAERGLETHSGFDDTGAVVTRCPVCHHDGSLEVHLDVNYEIDAEWSDGEQVTSVHPFWEVAPFRFTCHVCGLTINGNEELLAAGLPAGTMTPDESELRTEWDISEFITEYPPDLSS